MKSVDLRNEDIDLTRLLHLAEKEAVLLVARDGHEFILAEADDFDEEVEALRSSERFQSFLDQRMQTPGRVPLEEIEREIETKLRASR
jgi:hypothetical protein